MAMHDDILLLVYQINIYAIYISRYINWTTFSAFLYELFQLGTFKELEYKTNIVLLPLTSSLVHYISNIIYI